MMAIFFRHPCLKWGDFVSVSDVTAVLYINMKSYFAKSSPADRSSAALEVLNKFPLMCDLRISASQQVRARRQSTREAAIVGSTSVNSLPSAGLVSAAGFSTRSALANSKRWLAVDSGITNLSDLAFSTQKIKNSQPSWDHKHQLYYWPSTEGSGPSFASNCPSDGESLSLIVHDSDVARVSVGSHLGFISCPYLAVTGGRRVRSIVGLYDCPSRPGDCGSLVVSHDGVVGLHCGTLIHKGVRVNAYYPFNLPGLPTHDLEVAKEHFPFRQSGKARPADVRVVNKQKSKQSTPATLPRPSSGPILDPPVKVAGVSKEASIVSMSPAPSTIASRDVTAVSANTARYIELLMNPWAASPVRLPDHVVTPTSLARFVANRTYQLTPTSSTSFGTNLLFAMTNRLCTPGDASDGGVAVESISCGSIGSSAAGIATYSYTPGSIMVPQQWGSGGFTDPHIAMAPISPISLNAGPWADGFGTSMQTTVGFIAAYRTLSMAMRVRIIGLPTGQFMTPGVVYFAQVRMNHSDLPVTQQDFVQLEQLGRASHVSADAIREAGSKTLFYSPDGPQKFSMTSNFVAPPGVFGPADATGWVPAVPGAGVRYFPGAPAVVQKATDFTRNIVPYLSQSNTNLPSSTPDSLRVATVDATDAANADSSTLLVMAYFGIQEGVVLEVDYAHIVEYIPNNSAPAGIEAVVQLPDSAAMDSIFASAAVMTEARPVLIQQPGDLTLVSAVRGGPSPTREAVAARNRLTSQALRSRGSAYREGFWDFDWLKKGSFGDGDGAISWDFSGKKPSKSKSRR